MGRYEHGKYEDAYADLHRTWRTWVFENINQNSASGMKALKNYFEERRNYENKPGAMALMAMGETTDQIDEQDLIAILDTGCNQTCHGDRWLQRYVQATGQPLPEVDPTSDVRIQGIGGHIRTAGIMRKLPLILELVNGGLAQGDLTSTELLESDAPLLISVQAQRALGLIIDIAGEVVHSPKRWDTTSSWPTRMDCSGSDFSGRTSRCACARAQPYPRPLRRRAPR